MADLNQQDYGFRPFGGYAAWQQGMEDVYVKEARARQRQLEEEKMRADMLNKAASTRSYEAQTAAMRDSIEARKEKARLDAEAKVMAAQEGAVLKKAQAEDLALSREYPLVTTLAGLAEQGMYGNNPAALAQAAQLWNRMAPSMSQQTRTMMGDTPSTYDIDGQRIESTFNPELMLQYAKSALRSKGQYGTDKAEITARQRAEQVEADNAAKLEKADRDNATRIALMEASNANRLKLKEIDKAIAEKKIRPESLGQVAAGLQKRHNELTAQIAQTEDPISRSMLQQELELVQQTINNTNRTIQESRPVQMETTIPTEGTGLIRAPKTVQGIGNKAPASMDDLRAKYLK